MSFWKFPELRIGKTQIKQKRGREKTEHVTPEAFRHAPGEMIWLSSTDSTCQQENRGAPSKPKAKRRPSHRENLNSS
jgi:hypothetical protein